MPQVLSASNPHDGLLRYADVEYDVARFAVRRNGRFIPLSTMQMHLLHFLMENPEVVFSRKQLLEAVWENDKLQDGAVTACVMRIRAALNAAGEPNLIRSIVGLGYALDINAEDSHHRRVDRTSRRDPRVTDSSPPRNATATRHF